MKVSTKIITGFLALMLLGMILLVNQLTAIHQMQNVNRELSELNVMSATTVLQVQKLADLLGEDSKKYFASLDPLYERQMTGFRSDFLEDLDRLRETAKSAREQTELAKLADALNAYWQVYNKLKEQKKNWDPDTFLRT